MESPPQVGQIIRLQSWPGVVLDVFTKVHPSFGARR